MGILFLIKNSKDILFHDKKNIMPSLYIYSKVRNKARKTIVWPTLIDP